MFYILLFLFALVNILINGGRKIMRKFPRVFIYSKEKNLYIQENISSAGTIDTAKSFNLFSLLKHVYLRLVKNTWKHTTTDWELKRIHHVTAVVGIKAGRMKL